MSEMSRANRSATEDHLREITDFGANPGGLRMLTYVPSNVPADAPLVVVLHGCTQTAGGYDVGAGWSTLADRYGFVLLLPEQSASNNPNRCFNWFQDQDTRRDSGEAASIRAMIDTMIASHSIDRAKIFVTGLSAGGAMTSAMLAAYPDLFAGGAIVAGLPHGAANDVRTAFSAMAGDFSGRDANWPAHVTRASSHSGPWPVVSIWHGSADATVASSNADAIIAQWRGVHGVDVQPSSTGMVDGHARRAWKDDTGREVIEAYSIAGLGHGTPLATGSGDAECGRAGPFLLEAGISSSYHIAKFWGLTENRIAAATVPAPALKVVETARSEPAREKAHTAPEPKPGRPASQIQQVIEGALRKAGLM
jgi:poly(hydroxyalkanoate) depolymerase family esterase